MSIEATIQSMARAARTASHSIARCPSAKKNDALLTLADIIEESASEIQAENKKDLGRAGEMGLSDAMIDRLLITDSTLDSMAEGLRHIVRLADPVGAMSNTWLRPNGLQVAQMRIPLGVIGIIYESRPNVTIDAAGLCLKAGNAVILRGGSEAFHSNQALAAIIGRALRETDLPPDIVQVVQVGLELLRFAELTHFPVVQAGDFRLDERRGLIQLGVESNDAALLITAQGITAHEVHFLVSIDVQRAHQL